MTVDAKLTAGLGLDGWAVRGGFGSCFQGDISRLLRPVSPIKSLRSPVWRCEQALQDSCDEALILSCPVEQPARPGTGTLCFFSFSSSSSFSLLSLSLSLSLLFFHAAGHVYMCVSVYPQTGQDMASKTPGSDSRGPHGSIPSSNGSWFSTHGR